MQARPASQMYLVKCRMNDVPANVNGSVLHHRSATQKSVKTLRDFEPTAPSVRILGVFDAHSHPALTKAGTGAHPVKNAHFCAVGEIVGGRLSPRLSQGGVAAPLIKYRAASEAAQTGRFGQRREATLMFVVHPTFDGYI